MKNNTKKRRGLWWKIPLGLMLILLVALAALLLNIDAIARTQINKAMNRYLAAGGNLESIDIQLIPARVNLAGITINSPKGFGQEPLFALRELKIDVAPLALLSGKVLVERVTIKRLSLNIVRDEQGRLSPLELLPATAIKDERETVEDKKESGPPWIPAVHIDAIQAADLSFQLNDKLMDKKWSAGLNLDMAIAGLKLEDLAAFNILVEKIDLAINRIAVDQVPGFSQNPLLAIDNIQLASDGIDLRASKVSVSKIHLDTLSASLERNPKGDVNLLKLVDSWMPLVQELTSKTEPIEDQPATHNPQPAFPLPTLIVNDIQLKSITAQLLDTIDGQPWRAGFDDLGIQIKDLAVSDLAKQALLLESFDMNLNGIAVDQVPGFGDQKLFSLKRFVVNSEDPDLSSEELVIKEVLIQGLSSSVTMRSDGLTNIQKLKEALLRDTGAPPQDNAEAIDTPETPNTEAVLPAVRFDKILVEDGSVTYRYEVFAEEPLVAVIKNIRAEVTQLQMFTDDTEVDPASAAVSFELEQPGKLPTAYFGTLAEVGPVNMDIPMVNTQVRLVGLKLDTLGSLVPKATRTALGASGLDIALALAMDMDSINLNASVLTDHDIQYEGITVQGSLDAPVVKIGPVLTGVFTRVSDGLVNIGKDGLKSGVDIAGGGVDAAKELGTGAVKVGTNLGKSLFGTAAGVITFDKQKVQKGVSGTTKGTVDLTTNSVKGSGQAAGGGLKNSTSSLKGGDRVSAWENEIPNRYREHMQQAGDALAKMPYQPVTK